MKLYNFTSNFLNVIKNKIISLPGYMYVSSKPQLKIKDHKDWGDIKVREVLLKDSRDNYYATVFAQKEKDPPSYAFQACSFISTTKEEFKEAVAGDFIIKGRIM